MKYQIHKEQNSPITQVNTSGSDFPRLSLFHLHSLDPDVYTVWEDILLWWDMENCNKMNMLFMLDSKNLTLESQRYFLETGWSTTD